MLKLFVDDIRSCPEGWVPARTVTEAIRILATQIVTEVSLDHDITCEYGLTGSSHSSPETFEPVAWYLALMGGQGGKEWIYPTIRIHTANVEAGRRMAQIMGIPYNNEIYSDENY